MGTKFEDYGIDEDYTNLGALLKTTLETVVAVYATAGVPLPTRRYYTMGRPAEDCEQVVVSFLQMYLGAPGDQATDPQRCSAPRSAVLNISVTRNVAVSQNASPPSPERIMNDADFSAADAWVLMEALREFDTWGAGIPGPGVIATVAAPEQNGGVQTINMNLTVAIP